MDVERNSRMEERRMIRCYTAKHDVYDKILMIGVHTFKKEQTIFDTQSGIVPVRVRRVPRDQWGRSSGEISEIAEDI